jgi:type IV pilus assembly protein PilF
MWAPNMADYKRYQVALRVCAAGIAVGAGLLLGGCASSPAHDPMAPPDAFTESDVPEARKRAANRLNLAILYFQDGKNTIALDEVKQGIAADPNWFELYNMRGLIHMQSAEFSLADASFQKALSINPGSSEVKHNYAVLLCKLKRLPESIAMFRSALSNPAYSQASNSLMEQGLCYMGAGQKREAEASFVRALEADASNPSANYHLAALLLERGDLVRAQFHARRLNSNERSNAQSLWLGIKIERRLDNRDAVMQLAGQLRKRFPQSRETVAFDRGAFDE